MTQSKGDTQTSVQDVALIVGGGPGISSSCARLFAENGMLVGVAARNPDKAVLQTLEKTHDVRRYACDAAQPAAVAPRFAEAGEGAIVNISSVVGLAPEFGMSVYGATKAFVAFLSQGLSLELGPKGVYVQAVLPAATRTEIWERASIDVNTLPVVMEVGELVDAALVGFDRREPVTIPPLHDAGQWDAYQVARQAILPGIRQERAAPRYQTSF